MTRTTILSSALAFAFVSLSASSAFAGPCDSFNSYAKKIQSGYKKACGDAKNKGLCKDRPKLMSDAAEALAFWNNLAGESWAKIGARTIRRGQTQQGTVVNPGMRTWVTASPSTSSSANVNISKRGGEANVRINICAVDPETGRTTQLFGPKETEGSLNQSVRGTAGKFILVRIAGAGNIVKGKKKPGIGRKYAYSIRIK